MTRDAANDPDKRAGVSDMERVLTTLAAMVEGDRALNIDGAALLLGVPVGTFRQLSARPGFPAPPRWGSA